MIPKFKQQQNKEVEQDDRITALENYINNIKKANKVIYTTNSKGVLIRCTKNTTYDKYAIHIIGVSNDSLIAIDTILRIAHSNSKGFTVESLNNGIELKGITTKMVNNIGYLHIPLPTYSILQIETLNSVEMVVSNETMPN